MRRIFDRSGPVITVTVAALMSAFLGFSQCGGHVSVERAVTAVIIVVVVAAVGYRMARAASGSWRARVVSQVPFVAGAVVTLVVGFKVGAALYMPPHSLSEWLAFGC